MAAREVDDGGFWHPEMRCCRNLKWFGTGYGELLTGFVETRTGSC